MAVATGVGDAVVDIATPLIVVLIDAVVGELVETIVKELVGLTDLFSVMIVIIVLLDDCEAVAR